MNFLRTTLLLLLVVGQIYQLPAADNIDPFLGKWYSEPIYNNFFQAQVFSGFEIVKDGSVKFNVFAIYKNEQGDKVTAVQIQEISGKYRFDKGFLLASLPETNVELKLQNNANAPSLVAQQIGGESTWNGKFFTEENAPWSEWIQKP